MSDQELPDGVVVVRIDQGPVRNAVNSETAQRLHDEFQAFDADDSQRVAVLTGDEQAFSAGANLRDLPRLRDSGPLGPTRLQLSKPVIAAIEGWCVAGGVELAAWCDLRVAGTSSRIGCLERRWGVPLIDGGTYRLPQIVGLGRALDLILTGREIGTEEAERMGFLNRVVPDGEALATAIELAGEIASHPWRGVVNDRKSVYAGLGRPLEEALAIEDELGRDTIFADDFRDGVAALRRPPGHPRSLAHDICGRRQSVCERCRPQIWFRGRGWRRWDRCGPAPGPRSRAPRRWCANRRLRPAARPPTRSTARRRGRHPESPMSNPTASWNTARTRSHSSPAAISRARQKAFASPPRSSLSASGVSRQQRGSRCRSFAFTASGMLPT